MRKFREPLSRKQISILPPSIEEYVNERDLVRYIDVLVDEMDLQLIESCYSEFGRPAYSPRVLLKIIFYGKMRGIRSSRELAQACKENLKFMFVAGHESPDFRTISDFRKTHHEHLGQLLGQTIEIGVRAGIIKLEHVAIDGTKIGAFAGRRSFKSAKYLKEWLVRLQMKLKDSFQEDIVLDKEEELSLGDDYEMVLPEDIEDIKALREKIKEALKHYEAVEGEKPNAISITDPESRFMKGKGINPSYNALAAVDKDSRMVVGGYVTNAVSDNAELKPSLEEIHKNTGSNPAVITADKGFRAHEGLVELEKRVIDGYVPPPNPSSKNFTLEDFKYNADSDAYICPNDKILKFKSNSKTKGRNSKNYVCNECQGCPLKEACMQKEGATRQLTVSVHQNLVDHMKIKTESEIGKQMAKIRLSVVEPLFGYLKASKKLRQFFFRGQNMINSMWRLELAAYNLEKLAIMNKKIALQAA